jgi:predicted adenylyl cyclase CyaB
MIEVEIRSFIDEKMYERLHKFLKEKAKFLDETFQITVYFNAKIDLRIQQSKNYSKLWVKGGKIHDTFREEIEVKFKSEDFLNLIKILRMLNFPIRMVWLRKRLEFEWNGIKVYLDDTEGYGKIVELECYAENKEEIKKSEELLKERLKQLNVELTPREEFEKKFKWYEKNWKDLMSKRIKELGLNELLG